MTLWRWRTVGCIALGGARLHCEERDGRRHYSRPQWESIKSAMERSPDERLKVNGRTYLSLRVATREDPIIRRCARRLLRWARAEGQWCPLLGRRLDAEKFPFRARRGFRRVWMFSREDLREIGAALLAGRVSDGVHGPGLTYAEAARMGFGRDTLQRLSDQDGPGAAELGGDKLDTWTEYRVTADGDIRAVRVFDPEYLRRLKEARKNRATAAPDKADGVSGREAMARYGHLFRAGDLVQWRTACGFLGRPLRAWKVPAKCLSGGEWRYDQDDLAEIARQLGEDPDRPHKDPTTGALYLPLRPFMRLTGWPEQQVANYRDRRAHSALGRKLDWQKITRPKRRNRHAEIYVYAQRDGERIKQWEKAGCPRKGWEPLPLPGQSNGAKAGRGTAPARTQGGTESRTGRNCQEPDRLPQEPWPVVIVQPKEQPVPVTCIGADGGLQADAHTARPCIYCTGERQYRLDGGRAHALDENEDCVLQAFLQSGDGRAPVAMGLATLREVSGVPHADKVLKRIAGKHGFGAAIDLPKGKGRGGYGLNILDGRPAGPSTNRPATG
jgi:hypothetical protein